MRYLGACTAAALAAALTACSAKPDANDKSKPSVVINVRGIDGQYVPTSSATMSASGSNQLNMNCVVKDPGGVSAISLAFSSGTGSCTVGSTIYNGVFSIATVPPTQSATYVPDAQGNVKDEHFYFATLTGPFSCNVPGVGTGVPYGATITATCTGKNYSSNANNKTATAKLSIKLQ
ncbi:MAG: hypothetical protein WCG00_15865 [Hyphomicrobiales bacterium]